MAHVEPDGDVVIRGLPSSDCVVDIFHGDTWVTSVSVVMDGSMVLPSHLFDDAIANRLRLVLSIDGEVYGGYIIFLPVVESEPFSLTNTVIRSNGEILEEQTAYRCTELIDVQFVEEFVYKGYLYRTECSAVYAYGNNGEPIKELAGSSNKNRTLHFIPDGTYAYIRACSNKSVDYSLELHYRSRRPR